jgi:hypothetical protein
MTTSPERRWYQVTFTLRDLFWLILVVALSIAYWKSVSRLRVDHNAAYHAIRHAERRQDDLLRAIQAEGYSANWNESNSMYELTKKP